MSGVAIDFCLDIFCSRIYSGSLLLRWFEMQMDHHHVKYKEIHGEDKVIFISNSEHKKLHARLRREGKCNVPVDVLSKISIRAYHRRLPFIKQFYYLRCFEYYNEHGKYKRSVKGQEVIVL